MAKDITGNPVADAPAAADPFESVKADIQAATVAAPPAADTYDPFTTVMGDIEAARQQAKPPASTTAMRAADVASDGMTPERAADLHRLSGLSGLPTDAVDANYDLVKARTQASAASYQDIAERHQVLADWLKDPVNAALARGDTASLQRLSEATQDLSRPPLPWWEAIVGSAQKSAKSSYEILTSGPALIQDELRNLLGITGDPTTGTPLAEFYRAHDDIQEIETAESGYKSTMPQRTIGGLVGMAADPLNILVPGAASAAAKAGAFLTKTALERSGQSLLMRVLTNPTTDHAVAAGLGLGELSGGRALIEGAQASRTAAPGEGPSAIDTAANVMAQSAIGYLGGRYLSFFREPGAALTPKSLMADLTGQTALGAGMGVAGTVAQTVTQEHRAPTGAELTESAVSGGVGGLALAGVTAAMEHYSTQFHVANLKAAAQLRTAAKMDAAMKEIAASKSAELSPDAISQLVDSIADKNGLGNGAVFMQTDDFDAHQAANGKDPAIAAQQMGLGDAYLKAKALNGPLELPIGSALRMRLDEQGAPDLSTKFTQDTALPSTAEALERVKQQPELQRQMAEREKAIIEQMRQPEAPQGADYVKRLREQALAAGRPPEEAQAAGKVLESVMTKLAQVVNAEHQKLGLPLTTPQRLADQFGVRIRAAVPEMLERAQAGGELSKLFKRLREEGPKSPADDAAREALQKAGLDPLTMTDEQIHEGLKRHLEAPEGGAALEQARKAQPEVKVQDGRILAGGKDVGTAEVIPQTAKPGANGPEIAKLYVDKGEQRQGVGRAVIGQVFRDHPEASEIHVYPGGTSEPFWVRMGAKFTGDGWMSIKRENYEAKTAVPEPRKIPVQGVSMKSWDLMRMFRKATGDRRMVEGKQGWKLIQEQAFRDEANRQPVLPLDPLALPEHQAPSISDRIAELKRQWMDVHDGKAPESEDEEWKKRMAAALADDLGAGGKFFQVERGSDAQDRARGTFQIGADRQSVITLFQTANRSTLIHELGHYFLEVMGDLASGDNAPATLKADFAKAMEWTGYESRENMVAAKTRLDELYREIGDGVPTAARSGPRSTTSASRTKCSPGASNAT